MSNSITTKRFVMRKSLIGNNTIITFTTKKGTFTSDHDAVYAANQHKLETMDCWHKYGNDTNSNNLPTWAREHQVTAE